MWLYSSILSKALAGTYIRVPLDREFLAARYIRFGFTHGTIARLLRRTESGVTQFIARVKESEDG